jgi:hypothetical protein
MAHIYAITLRDQTFSVGTRSPPSKRDREQPADNNDERLKRRASALNCIPQDDLQPGGPNRGSRSATAKFQIVPALIQREGYYKVKRAASVHIFTSGCLLDRRELFPYCAVSAMARPLLGHMAVVSGRGNVRGAQTMFDAKKPSSDLPPIEDVFGRLHGKVRDPEQQPKPIVRGRDLAKTRFLNFRFNRTAAVDGAAEGNLASHASSCQSRDHDLLARLTVVVGPGRGETFELSKPMVQIGRDENQDVSLNFGDNTVSRRCHASIVWYGGNVFAIRDGLKPNPVLLNGATLTGEDVLKSGDLIQLGETVLRFRSA